MIGAEDPGEHGCHCGRHRRLSSTALPAPLPRRDAAARERRLDAVFDGQPGGDGEAGRVGLLVAVDDDERGLHAAA